MFHNISYANPLSDVDRLGAAIPCSASPNAGHQAPADAARVVGIAGQFRLEHAIRQKRDHDDGGQDREVEPEAEVAMVPAAANSATAARIRKMADCT